MRFAYIFFLALYCVIGICGIGATTFTLCKANDNKTIVSCVIAWLGWVGFIAQFIADGIRVIGN